jgi:hypothetical protein
MTIANTGTKQKAVHIAMTKISFLEYRTFITSLLNFRISLAIARSIETVYIRVLQGASAPY